jgi:hypothetical protein
VDDVAGKPQPPGEVEDTRGQSLRVVEQQHLSHVSTLQ